MSRYIVKKPSGSQYAYVVDTQDGGKFIGCYDVFKRDGWARADRKAAAMNAKGCERGDKVFDNLRAED